MLGEHLLDVIRNGGDALVGLAEAWRPIALERQLAGRLGEEPGHILDPLPAPGELRVCRQQLVERPRGELVELALPLDALHDG